MEILYEKLNWKDSFFGNVSTIYAKPERIYYPIKAMGFSAMFTFLASPVKLSI